MNAGGPTPRAASSRCCTAPLERSASWEGREEDRVAMIDEQSGQCRETWSGRVRQTVSWDGEWWSAEDCVSWEGDMRAKDCVYEISLGERATARLARGRSSPGTYLVTSLVTSPRDPSRHPLCTLLNRYVVVRHVPRDVSSPPVTAGRRGAHGRHGLLHPGCRRRGLRAARPGGGADQHAPLALPRVGPARARPATAGSY
jgi:hypothetical protein